MLLGFWAFGNFGVDELICLRVWTNLHTTSNLLTMTPNDDVPHAEASRDPLPTPGLQGPYREVRLRRSNDLPPLADDVCAALTGAGYSPRDCFAVRLALEEAIVNGLRHGNGGDPSRCVLVRYRVTPEAVLAEVEDEGPGFDPDGVPDATLAENREKTSGRGLLLLRSLMSWVQFSERGNCVTLCKLPSA
jgi:serine/threonine-protein kinase RsbW